MMLSFFNMHYTPFVNLSSFAFNSLYFSFQGLNPIEIDYPHLLTLRAFSELGIFASLRVRWLMELSSANHAHSSHQARGDYN
jgi:hypothetical protein